MKLKYPRILLKLSGEALLGDNKKFGIDYDVLDYITQEIIGLKKAGAEVIVVIGAGNIWRGAENKDSGINRVSSDYIGMLGTVMNSVALQASLENYDHPTRVCSAIDIPAIAEAYIRRRAMRHIEKGRIIICSGGTGNPYFTTDSAAALRSLELNCDALVKATNVDGVYNTDPQKDPSAKKFAKICFDEVLEKNLKVMDGTAIAQCRDHNMPIIVFRLLDKGALFKIIQGDNDIGTIIHST